MTDREVQMPANYPEGDSANGCNQAQSSSGWRKSSYSASNGHCVEIARLPGGAIGIRDSKAAGGPILSFAPSVWSKFVEVIRHDLSSG